MRIPEDRCFKLNFASWKLWNGLPAFQYQCSQVHHHLLWNALPCCAKLHVHSDEHAILHLLWDHLISPISESTSYTNTSQIVSKKLNKGSSFICRLGSTRCRLVSVRRQQKGVIWASCQNLCAGFTGSVFLTVRNFGLKIYGRKWKDLLLITFITSILTKG